MMIFDYDLVPVTDLVDLDEALELSNMLMPTVHRAEVAGIQASIESPVRGGGTTESEGDGHASDIIDRGAASRVY
jgi:hypothetical protein